MPNQKIFNRKVYMLIDQSSSMFHTDILFNNERRWKYITEVIEGHVYNILNFEGINGEKICDEITLTFFNEKKTPKATYNIQDDSEVAILFEKNQPHGDTFLAPTLEKIVGQWFATRKPDEGGFIVIYTDGVLDDYDAFLNCVKETCSKLNNQDELKVVIIGLGSDIDRDPKFYLKLDANVLFTDRNSAQCDIIVFDMLNKMSGIIELLDRQLVNPEAGLPVWGKEFCPELYD
ncbi:MAG: hypothetical protein F6K40_00660 [Okeania sp. SIO3I5]|uniref:hypothetical protein n=1 Tax=Okeania sp. SIO3I5 TaxID=2607805 RepID=UPI0013BC61D0|nr:hypothetical protein [Okeania sp. SIO3I5]NEQ34898.1 hypothetical protein [Okeania sp. SIO3I5]